MKFKPIMEVRYLIRLIGILFLLAVLIACASSLWWKEMGFNSYEEAVKPSSVPKLIELLEDSNSKIRAEAAYALGMVKPAAINAVPHLLKNLQDSSPNVRSEVIWALSRIDSESKEVRQAYVKALGDRDPSVQLSAIRMIGKQGTKAKAAVPGLIKILNGSQSEIRSQAAWALGEISYTSKEVVFALVKALEGGNPNYLRETSAKAIGQLGPQAKEAVPYLIKALNDSFWSVRAEVVRALGKMGPEAEAAIPGLIKALEDGRHPVDNSAIIALGEIGPQASDAVPALVKKLGSYYPANEFAKTAIEKILPHTKQQVQAMIRTMGYSDPLVRIQAMKYLGEIGPKAKVAIPVLTKAFGDDDPQVRLEAVDAALKIEGENESIAPAFIMLLNDPEPELREKALLTLRNIGHSDVGYLNILQNVANNDPDESIRELASDSLRKFQFAKLSTEKPSQPKKKVPQKPKAVIPPPPTPIQRDFSKKWAVVIGISSYQDTRISSLRYASRDAEAFYRWLVSPDGGKYAPANVKVLLDRDGSFRNIRDALFVWLKQALEEDMVTIYFAGHGSPESPDSMDNLFLLPYDVQYDNIAITGFPMWDIETALKRFIKAKRVVVIADACHSGGVGQSFDIARRANRGIKVNSINKGFQNLSGVSRGICVISASDEKQYSRESKDWGGGHGVFTYYLLKGLKGEADYSMDSEVTLGELIPYLSEHVRRATNGAQSPTVAGKFDPALSIGE